MQILKSQIDKSVNFIEEQLTGFIESRYVRRTDDYFIAYLSSQTGCNRGCVMCHLTATKQTMFTNCDLSDFVNQLETVFSHYEKDNPAKILHINWMARGEPLANPTVTETSTELLLKLGQMAKEKELQVKYNISTIIPKTLRKSLVECFPIITPTIYYSLYSMDKPFRTKWLPAAMDADKALDLLIEYQSVTKKIIKFHGAFIHGENDSEYSIYNMMKAIKSRGIVGQFNIVRYNPFSAEQGIESERLSEIESTIKQFMPCKIITKVGPDNYASCGQFFPK